MPRTINFAFSIWFIINDFREARQSPPNLACPPEASCHGLVKSRCEVSRSPLKGTLGKAGQFPERFPERLRREAGDARGRLDPDVMRGTGRQQLFPLQHLVREAESP